MNKKEREILNIEQSFKDTLENEIAEQNTENKKIEIKDIKYAGKATWKDKINGKDISEAVLIVEKQIIEIDENGKERVTEQKNYYLGDKCIGGGLENNEVIYQSVFANSEPDKMQAVNKLLENVSDKELNEYSLSNLQNKELAEVLSVYLGKEIKPDEVRSELDKMSKDEIEELNKEKDDKKKDEKEENSLTEKQTEKVKVNGIQKVDLNTKVDGKENLAQRLDLKEYDSIYVIYSDNVKEISKTSKEKINNTTYSLVGMKNDGTAKVLNDEFEMDKTVGNNASKEQTKVRADSTATRDNKDQSVYTRKSNGASIGCENDMGNVNMFLYQKTKEENENVGIQIETSRTKRIPVETRRVFNRNQGVYQNDKIQDEIEEHTENECEPKDVKDFDGKEYTETHEHIDIDYYVKQIQNYENEDGEQSINEVFTEKEIKDKLLRELDKYKEKISIEQIIEDVKNEMDADAQIYTREHKLEQ